MSKDVINISTTIPGDIMLPVNPCVGELKNVFRA
jgi:hypothetical protein